MKIETFKDGSTIETDRITGLRTVCGRMAHQEYFARLKAEMIANKIMKKNFNAAALGRLGKGKPKTMSTIAIKSRLVSIAKARAARWPKKGKAV